MVCNSEFSCNIYLLILVARIIIIGWGIYETCNNWFISDMYFII